jgi:hypothetical protein
MDIIEYLKEESAKFNKVWRRVFLMGEVPGMILKKRQ